MEQEAFGFPDPRTQHWTLVTSPRPLFTIFVTYIFIVTYGPRFMKHRKPFSLRPLLLIYNFGQVVLSAYIFKEFVISSYLSSYDLKCQSIDPAPSPLAMRMADVCWWFYISKYIDLFDSIFFVLRKKSSQLTFLHVYHHSTMTFNWYIGVRYLPGGQAFFSGLCNSLVHVVMYSYYFLSALGPHVRPYLWWKKYLTQLQMLQFLAVMLHLMVGLYTGCEAPRGLQTWTILYTFSLLVLFTHFYIRAYHARIASKGQNNNYQNGTNHIKVN